MRAITKKRGVPVARGGAAGGVVWNGDFWADGGRSEAGFVFLKTDIQRNRAKLALVRRSLHRFAALCARIARTTNGPTGSVHVPDRLI